MPPRDRRQRKWVLKRTPEEFDELLRLCTGKKSVWDAIKKVAESAIIDRKSTGRNSVRTEQIEKARKEGVERAFLDAIFAAAGKLIKERASAEGKTVESPKVDDWFERAPAETKAIETLAWRTRRGNLEDLSQMKDLFAEFYEGYKLECDALERSLSRRGIDDLPWIVFGPDEAKRSVNGILALPFNEEGTKQIETGQFDWRGEPFDSLLWRKGDNRASSIFIPLPCMPLLQKGGDWLPSRGVGTLYLRQGNLKRIVEDCGLTSGDDFARQVRVYTLGPKEFKPTAELETGGLSAYESLTPVCVAENRKPDEVRRIASLILDEAGFEPVPGTKRFANETEGVCVSAYISTIERRLKEQGKKIGRRFEEQKGFVEALSLDLSLLEQAAEDEDR